MKMLYNFISKISLILKISTIILFSVYQTIESKERPNIIIFVADDLGWDDVGFHGSVQMRTPNIDTLAADGIILNNYYTSPVCSPSRGALLSGIHPINSGTQNYVILTPSPWGLPLNLKLLPQYLKDYDYTTHAVGKWHLGFYKHEYTPTFRGFDSHVGYWSGAEDYFDHTSLEDKQFWGIDFRHNMDLITNATGIYSTHYFTDRSLKLISDHNVSQPLFLYMSYQSCHGANNYARLQAPQHYIQMFDYIESQDRRTFAAMAYAMDESIGIIVNKLNERNMLKNSVIIFVSDNGGPASGFTGNAASNWPLRGVKATLWEGGIRVPALVWSPLLKKSGYVSNAMIHVTDILPTIMTAIGIKQPLNATAKDKIYGISMWDTLSHDMPSTRSEILHNIDPIWNVSAIRWNQWKLIQGLVFPNWSLWYPPFSFQKEDKNFEESERDWDRFSSLTNKALMEIGRNPNYDIIENAIIDCGPKPSNASINCRPDIELCLYNIGCDPCEYNNVANENLDIVKLLWNKILAYNKTAVNPGTVPSDPNSDPKLHNYAWSCWQDLNYN